MPDFIDLGDPVEISYRDGDLQIVFKRDELTIKAAGQGSAVPADYDTRWPPHLATHIARAAEEIAAVCAFVDAARQRRRERASRVSKVRSWTSIPGLGRARWLQHPPG